MNVPKLPDSHAVVRVLAAMEERPFATLAVIVLAALAVVLAAVWKLVG